MQQLIDNQIDVKTNSLCVFLIQAFLLVALASASAENEEDIRRDVEPIERTVQIQFAIPYQPPGDSVHFWAKGLPLHTTNNCRMVVAVYDELQEIPGAWLTDGGRHVVPLEAGALIVQGSSILPGVPRNREPSLQINLRFQPRSDSPVQFPIRFVAWLVFETTAPPVDVNELSRWWEAQAANEAIWVSGTGSLLELRRGMDDRLLQATGIVSPEGWHDHLSIDARSHVPPLRGAMGMFLPLRLTVRAELIVEEPEDLGDEQDPPRPQLRLVPSVAPPTP